MGGYFSTPVDHSAIVSKVLEDLERNRVEREIAFAQLQEKRKLAFKIAEEREKLKWSVSAGGLVVILSALASFHHKNLLHITPIFPVASYLGYKAHYCYGDQLERIRVASKLMLEEKSENLVPLPPSIADIRARAKELRRLADEETY